MSQVLDARVVAISAPDEKARIATAILHALPDWFGLPESTANYIKESRDLPFWAVMQGDTPLGFVTQKDTASHAAEIHCMGVLPGYHRQGLGKLLLHALEDSCRAQGKKLLQVKTVDEGHYPASYDKTIAFYEGRGFVRLEVFPEMWDPWNPCLILVKAL